MRHIAASPFTNTARAGPRAAINPPSMIEPLHPISLITGIDIMPANKAIKQQIKMSRCTQDSKFGQIGHVNENPTMHHFGNPIHTQSMIA